MDFAAAVGTKTIVFSPTNIMKVWATGGDRYIFSDQVKFICTEGGGKYEMLKRAAQLLSEC